GEYVFLFGREDNESGTVVVKNKRLDYVFRVKSEILEKIPAAAEDLKQEETEEIKEGKPAVSRPA
ncbi:MAG: hypothetical protein L6425_11580, partial [Candidatus Aminicenantes bacterium]|nr:hypothetical protein [Candidatus Aminicenantes bacterium]